MTSKFIILSAPSGSGKSTLASYLLSKIKNLSFSVSCTTRKMRKSEKNGIDYYFISKEEFMDHVKDNKFIEWEKVYLDDYKGTLISEINRLKKEGKHIIFDVDVVGGINLKNYFKDDALSIFVDVPSLITLKNRLNDRGLDSKTNINERLQKAKKELKEKGKFDKIIMNDNLKLASIELFRTVKKFIS